MARKLLEKARWVGAQKEARADAGVSPTSTAAVGDGPPPEPAAAPAAPRPKTAPGAMFDFIAAQSGAIQETAHLKERLAQFDGAHPARKLDPRTVRASKWANRHPASFADAGFTELKAEIESAGGNVQAIKVRPAASRNGSGGPSPTLEAGPSAYEIVFGHRRHRACLELGLPVLAVIEEMSDQQLFAEMDRENRDRKDLSAWEQGAMYARALDAGLFPSNRKLAESIGRDHSDINRALRLARLPTTVVDTFKSPLDLQFRWAKPLSDAQQKDPEALISRAAALKGKTGELTPKEIFEFLAGMGQGVGRSIPPADIIIKRDRQPVAKVCSDKKGRTQVRFEVELDAARRRDLAKLVEDFLAK